MNNMRVIGKTIALGAGFISLCLSGMAQDSSKKKTIDITSTFKPVLRDAVKLNFSAALPAMDSTKPVLNYSIPVQQVKLPYQPGTLKPVAMQIDSLFPWKNSQYVKVGAGNNHLPYAQAGFNFGDGKSSFLNLYGEVFASKGKLDFQKHNLVDVTARGGQMISEDHQVTAKVGFKGEDYFLYGYRPTTLDFSKRELRQQFQTIDGEITLRNTDPSDFGLSYQPSIRVVSFRHKNEDSSAREQNFIFKLPVQKTFGKSFGINLAFIGDMTHYKAQDKSAIKNNLFQLAPSLLLKTPNVSIQTGILPSWDNSVFHMLPNILADFTTNDKRFTFQAGYIGYFNKGSMQRFSTINPWIAQPSQLLNTRIVELYGGFKGVLAQHFTYNAKLGVQKQRNVNLFVNDFRDGKTFETVYAPEMDVVTVHGEIGYNKGEKFAFSSGVTYNNFVSVEGQSKAWGLFPLELHANLRWKVIDDLYFKTDFIGWDGPAYRNLAGEDRKGDQAYDLSAGLEFKVTRSFDLWLQMNNILNNRYERWNQYQVYGFNVMGGIIFRFNQK
ncbi:hypothetical protein [Flavihumibacter sp. UBA7668]|uniref:hypothetical protein n=1 Tax=Flavihumibacter sp. UBA7668 TaxID=1946542 RepID=UPI0025C3A9D4|nr:hypothetical protein [Flavihumibacter sp. UBA7668]